MKSNFWNNDDYRMKIAYADNLIYSTKSKFITCFTEKNKVLRNEVQAVLGKDFHSTDSDKLFFHDLIECFNPKYFPNIITNKFDQDLERSWRQKHKLFTFKKRLCMTLMVLLGLALALSPIIYSVANYYGV
jgi:hypothetical protein